MLSDNQSATRGKPRVALVTCMEFAELDADDRLLLGPLAARGVAPEPATWDAPGVDWTGYHLAVLRSPWDSAEHRRVRGQAGGERRQPGHRPVRPGRPRSAPAGRSARCPATGGGPARH